MLFCKKCHSSLFIEDGIIKTSFLEIKILKLFRNKLVYIIIIIIIYFKAHSFQSTNLVVNYIFQINYNTNIITDVNRHIIQQVKPIVNST
jgi:hypothetical protein